MYVKVIITHLYESFTIYVAKYITQNWMVFQCLIANYTKIMKTSVMKS